MTEPRAAREPREPREPTSPREPRDDLSIPLRSYVDRQLDQVRRAAELAATIPTEVVPLKDHFDTVVADLKEYFQAILDEQRRGMIVAEQEREKAAKALRDELARAIEEGDHNLREHIEMQVHQIREALDSQEKLDLQRHTTNSAESKALDRRIDEAQERGMSRLDGLRREQELIQGSAADAIAKAETANEKRFESVNEFRAQLSDQTSEFIRREVFDTTVGELRRSLTDVLEKINKVV